MASASLTWKSRCRSPSLTMAGMWEFTSTITVSHCSSTVRCRWEPHSVRLIQPFSSGGAHTITATRGCREAIQAPV